MHRNTFFSTAVVTSALVSPLAGLVAQQSDLTISPFVSFLPSAGTNPLAGLALALAGQGVGFRASGHVALKNSNASGFTSAGTMRPWGADVDAILGLGSRVGLRPFVFAGLGMSGSDSVGYNETHNNWSYGAGATLPLGSAVDVFGEARWRMSKYILPTASTAPSPTNELRVGLSFNIGGPWGGGTPGRRYSSDNRIDATASRASSVVRYPVSSTSASTKAARVIGTADQYVGIPYRYGGTSPESGFDCSGFVQYVFDRQGVRLPRTASQQAAIGKALAPDWRALVAGDLVMFAEDGRIDHVAIYAGNNRIIHSSSTGGGVRYDDLSSQRGEWFASHLAAARRVTPTGPNLLLDLSRNFSQLGLALDPPDHAPRAR